MGDTVTCTCFRRLREIRAAGGARCDFLDELTAILRCTQRPDCSQRHECSDGVREMIQRALHG